MRCPKSYVEHHKDISGPVNRRGKTVLEFIFMSLTKLNEVNRETRFGTVNIPLVVQSRSP